jgi:hypothetical protein
MNLSLSGGVGAIGSGSEEAVMNDARSFNKTDEVRL